MANQGKAKRGKGQEVRPADGPRRPLIDERLAKAISHPARVEIMVEAVKASIFSTFMLQGQLALEADTMDSQPNTHVTWTPLRLDKQGFDNLMARLKEVYDQAGVEQLASEARLEDSGEEAIHTTLGMFGFESPAPDRDHTPEPR